MTIAVERSDVIGFESPPHRPAQSDPRDAQFNRKRLLDFARRLLTEGGLTFALFLALYLAVGAVLDFHYLTFQDDAYSRAANGYYMFASNDPHLASIGFVWNPGMSVADILPLLFSHFWRPLATHIYGASIVSSVCMAGAIYQLRCLLAEWGVGRSLRLVLVALFGLNAMILYYGGNGMSEGLYLFTLGAAARYLLRWMREDDLASLVYSASALGLCYLVRNEAVGAAFLGGLLVLGLGYMRRRGPRDRRVWGALTDFTIFEIPIFCALVAWAVCSYVITGQAFQQFTSVYGTSSQIKVAGFKDLHGRLMADVHYVMYLAPALPVVALVAILVAARRRDWGVLAPIAILGGGLAFSLIAYADNSTQGWYRYYITAIPLDVILVGSLFASRPALVTADRQLGARTGPSRWTRPGLSVLSVLVALLLLAPSAVTTIKGMTNINTDPEEVQDLGFILLKHPSKTSQEAQLTYPRMLTLANYLANMHLSDGQVVVDNFSGCMPFVILLSPNPKIFTIPNDRKFQRILDDPLTFNARYILDSTPKGDGALTAVNTTYPQLWKSGGGFATDVQTFPAGGECPEFKLYKVTGHPNRL